MAETDDISVLPRITVTPRPPDYIQPGSQQAQQMTHQEPAPNPVPHIYERALDYAQHGLSANPAINDLLSQIPGWQATKEVIQNPDYNTAVGMVGGPMGSTIDELLQMARASRMEAMGASPQRIWDATQNWYRNPASRNWMQEWSDQGMYSGIPYLDAGKQVEAPLNRMVYHPWLRDRYPDLDEMSVTAVNPHPSDPRAEYRALYYHPYKGEPEKIELLRPNDPERTVRSTAHEVQHAIARREGFPFGSAASGPEYDRDAGEWLARLSASRVDLDPSEISAMPRFHWEGGAASAVPYHEQVPLGARPHFWDQRGWPGPRWDNMTPGAQRLEMERLRQQILQVLAAENM